MAAWLVALVLLAAGDGLKFEAAADPAQVTVSVPWPAAPKSEPLDPEAAAQVLTLHVVDPSGSTGLPLLARYELAGDRLQLVPRYPLLPGHRYRARWYVQGADQPPVERDYVVATGRPIEPPEVVSVEPAHAVVPANLLRFYITFSRPMREGHQVFERIELLDDRGEPVPDPWRPVELWSQDGRRLTLYLHPGRIKRGVNLREEIGPLMTPGRRYSLVVRANFSDAQGQPLGTDFVHSFTTSAEDRDCPELKRWMWNAPTAGSREPLVVQFPEPLDRVLAVRCLQVLNANGKSLNGEPSLGTDGLRWTWTPAEPWTDAPHRIQVDPALEDLAGNSPFRPFEVDVQAQPASSPPVAHLEFRPQAPHR